MRTQQFTFVRSITWVFCFLSYTAARMDSESTRYLVIYAQIIVQFAQCHGGTGWLINDQLFWQQAAMGGGEGKHSLEEDEQFFSVRHSTSKLLWCETSISSQCQSDDYMALNVPLVAQRRSLVPKQYQPAFTSFPAKLKSMPPDSICRTSIGMSVSLTCEATTISAFLASGQGMDSSSMEKMHGKSESLIFIWWCKRAIQG